MSQNTSKEKATLHPTLTVFVFIICLSLAIVHALVPEVQIDATTVALLLLPFLLHYLPSFTEFEAFGMRAKRELDQRINEIEENIESVEASPDESTFIPSEEQAPLEDLPSVYQEMRDYRDEIYGIASISHLGALSAVRRIFETELRRLVYAYEQANQIERTPHRYGSRLLAEQAARYDLLTPSEHNALQSIFTVANRAVHGEHVTSEQSVRIIELALRILPHVIDRRYITESRLEQQSQAQN